VKTYLRLTLLTITGLLVSCGGNGSCGQQGPDGWRHMMYYGHGYGCGGMFMWIIILIVVGLVVYFIVRGQKTKGQTPTQNESHLDILKQRYAKGDITKEEYEGMKKDLEG
jgi:putative membrane protein